jgi:hypothetical protein
MKTLRSLMSLMMLLSLGGCFVSHTTDREHPVEHTHTVVEPGASVTTTTP